LLLAASSQPYQPILLILLPPALRLLQHLLATLYPVQQGAGACASASAGAAGALAKPAAAPPMDPRPREALMCYDLHAALLNCALEVVVHISEGQQAASRAFPWATQQAGRARATLSLWDAIRSAAALPAH
jgi:hypothetical protein